MPAPIIYGEFSNWKPHRMVDIRQYCEKLNYENRPDIFERCKEKSLIPQFANKREDLNPEELKLYE